MDDYGGDLGRLVVGGLVEPGAIQLSWRAVATDPHTEEAVQAAVAEAVDGYRRVFGDNLAQVWLYGSRAIGTHRPDSDVDLLAVLYDMVPLPDARRVLSSVAYPIRRAHRVRVDGQVTTVEELETNDNDFHHYVRVEGRRIDT